MNEKFTPLGDNPQFEEFKDNKNGTIVAIVIVGIAGIASICGWAFKALGGKE